MKESHYKKRYGQWAGRPNGSKPNFDKCAKEVFSGFYPAQCSKKCGHGPDGAYCAQHAKKLANRNPAE